MTRSGKGHCLVQAARIAVAAPVAMDSAPRQTSEASKYCIEADLTRLFSGSVQPAGVSVHLKHSVLSSRQQSKASWPAP